MTSLPARVVAGVIRFYQAAFSPALGPSCRYAPSCSVYALVAVERFGALRGSWLAFRRILRCHPWHDGGYDPVPLIVGRAGTGRASVGDVVNESRAAGPVAAVSQHDPLQTAARQRSQAVAVGRSL